MPDEFLLDWLIFAHYIFRPHDRNFFIKGQRTNNDALMIVICLVFKLIRFCRIIVNGVKISIANLENKVASSSSSWKGRGEGEGVLILKPVRSELDRYQVRAGQMPAPSIRLSHS